MWKTPRAADAGAGDGVGACTPFLEYDALRRNARQRVRRGGLLGALCRGTAAGGRFIGIRVQALCFFLAEAVRDTSLFVLR